MRTRLVRTYRFEAAHFLPNVVAGHKCARMHGHSYQVDITIEGDIGETTGWVMDFSDMDEHVMPLVKRLDHFCLNDIEGLTNPTSELLAVWFWTRLQATLPIVEIAVSETQNSRCVYRGQ